MTALNEHLASLDSTLLAAKTAWEAEKKQLEDRIFALETELSLRTTLHDKAVEARSNAEKMAAKLVAQFGMVAQVFDDAKQLAINAGLYSQQPSAPPVAPLPAPLTEGEKAVIAALEEPAHVQA